MDLENFHKLLSFGIDKGVSDIHFECGYPPHYRLNGELLGAIRVPPLTVEDTERIAQFILGSRSKNIDFTQLFGEIDVSYSLANKGRFRASIFRQRGAVGIVLRLIPVEVKPISDLYLPPVIEEIAEARRGLILVTGATGNGKSTTIAAIIRQINQTRHAHIITVEDPIEFLFEAGKCMIIQREVGTDTETFQDAVTSALRQDPDVIMVGEIRDKHTAGMCLKAAETGHMVISAIHTPDAMSTIQRYIGLFEPEAQDTIRERLGDALQAVVSLRLLRTVQNTGRVPAAEILRVTRTVRECIKTPGRLGEIPDLIKRGRDIYSMQLFDQHLHELCSAGIISREVALYASSNPEELERMLQFETA